jgi:hypothetical protein
MRPRAISSFLVVDGKTRPEMSIAEMRNALVIPYRRDSTVTLPGRGVFPRA